MITRSPGKTDAKKGMSYEFFSSFKLDVSLEQGACRSIDEVLRGSVSVFSIHDWYSRISILSQIIGKKSLKRDRKGNPITTNTKGLAIRSADTGQLDLVKFYALRKTQDYLKQQKEHIELLGLDTNQMRIDHYPEGTFLIRFDFTLTNPYISKDNAEFHIIDNPIRKEWVFKVPFVAGSQWKGALHNAMVKSLVENHGKSNVEDFIHRRLALTRIFGTEKGLPTDTSKAGTYLDEIGGSEASETFRQKIREILDNKEDEIPMISGRVILYPTYFDRIALEVINPHTEEVKGINPIYFETVPAGSIGTFCLLYVPLTQCWGNDFGDIERDLDLLKRGIYDLMLTYGFGAKTSIGYGRAKSTVEGVFFLRTSEGVENIPFTDLDSLFARDMISEEG